MARPARLLRLESSSDEEQSETGAPKALKVQEDEDSEPKEGETARAKEQQDSEPRQRQAKEEKDSEVKEMPSVKEEAPRTGWRFKGERSKSPGGPGPGPPVRPARWRSLGSPRPAQSHRLKKQETKEKEKEKAKEGQGGEEKGEEREMKSQEMREKEKVFERLYDDALVKRQEKARRRQIVEAMEAEEHEQMRQKAPEEEVLAMCERLYERRKKPKEVQRDEAEKKSFEGLEAFADAFAKQQSTWNAKRMARLEAERERQRDVERKWLHERSVHRSATPQRGTFERLYKDFGKRELRLQKLRADQESHESRTPSTRSHTGSEGARRTPRRDARRRGVPVKAKEVRARVALHVISAQTASVDSWFCTVEAQNDAPLPRLLLRTPQLRGREPRWDCHADAQLLEGDVLRFKLMKASGECVGESSLSPAILMMCSSGFHGDLTLSDASLQVSMKILEPREEQTEEKEELKEEPKEQKEGAALPRTPRVVRAPDPPYRAKPYAVTKAHTTQAGQAVQAAQAAPAHAAHAAHAAVAKAAATPAVTPKSTGTPRARSTTPRGTPRPTPRGTPCHTPRDAPRTPRGARPRATRARSRGGFVEVEISEAFDVEICASHLPRHLRPPKVDFATA